MCDKVNLFMKYQSISQRSCVSLVDKRRKICDTYAQCGFVFESSAVSNYISILSTITNDHA